MQIVIKLSAAGDLVQSFVFIQLLRKESEEKIILLTQKRYEDLAKQSWAHEVWTEEETFTKKSPCEISKIWDLQSTFGKRRRVQNLIKALTSHSQTEVKKVPVSFPFLGFHRLLFRLRSQKTHASSIQNAKGSVIQQQIRPFLSAQSWSWKGESCFQTSPPLFSPLSSPFVLWAPGASQNNKRLQAQDWIQWMEAYEERNWPYEIQGLGWGEEEYELVESVKKRFSFINNQVGQLSFSAMVKRTQQANLIWGVDSFLAHVSLALKKPTLIWLGATTRSQGYFMETPPWVRFIEETLNCRPCSRFGKKPCYYKNRLCFDGSKQKKYFSHQEAWMKEALRA